MSARAAKTRTREPSAIRTPSGASAEAVGEKLVVRDARGSIVVIYDAERGSAEISAPEGDLTLSAPKGKVAIAAPEVVCEAGRFELRANQVVEHAHDVFREIQGLLHTRVRRMRTIAHGAVHVFGKRVRLLAEEDASVDGKRVLLG